MNRLDANDWLSDRTCADCWAKPCACSWVTWGLERLARVLQQWLRRRYHHRQHVLNGGQDARTAHHG